jgi:hypothetical protein
MPGLDLSQIAVGVVAVASLISLLLLILKSLGKEFESVALLWIRVCRRISVERKKNGVISLPPQTSIDTDFKHE